MIKINAVIAILLFTWALYWIAQDNLEAMEACQEIRSYNSCAYDIMR